MSRKNYTLRRPRPVVRPLKLTSPRSPGDDWCRKLDRKGNKCGRLEGHSGRCDFIKT